MSSREKYADKLLLIGVGFLPNSDDIQNLASSGKVPWYAKSVIPFKMNVDNLTDQEALSLADMLLTSPEPIGCNLQHSDYEKMVIIESGKKYVAAKIA